MFILFVFISGVNFTFFPSFELDDIYVEYKTKPGTSIEKTKDYADKIVQKIQIVESQLSDSLGSEVFKEIEIKSINNINSKNLVPEKNKVYLARTGREKVVFENFALLGIWRESG